jgi:hypothetical protein
MVGCGGVGWTGGLVFWIAAMMWMNIFEYITGITVIIAGLIFIFVGLKFVKGKDKNVKRFFNVTFYGIITVGIGAGLFLCEYSGLISFFYICTALYALKLLLNSRKN